MVFSQTQFQHATRYLQQWAVKVPVAVIGGYHGGNLGDMALGNAVTQFLFSQGIKPGLQTIYNLDKWRKTPYAILGGGAIGYTDSLSRVAWRYRDDYKRVAIVGVDFNEQNYPDDCLSLIRGAAFVSCRSQAQANRLKELTGRKEIYHHPDIAFSLLHEFCTQQREMQEAHKQKKLLVNVVPLYAKIKDGALHPSEAYSIERPELYRQFSQMHASYKNVVRAVIQEALQHNYEVETVPFTPADETYGKLLLEGLPVKHVSYHSDPLKMLTKMATADWVFATRLHATIFALKLGVKLTPIAYATKNELLLCDLGIEREHFLSSGDLAKGIDEPLHPIKADSGKIKAWEINSTKAVKDGIHSLNINF